MKPWLSIIGIGEDGIEAISPAARALIEAAEVLVGGERHLDKVPKISAERFDWAKGFGPTLDRISQLQGSRVCILASGDPFCYGVGATLMQRFDAKEMTAIPAPSAFSLACARLGWSLPDVQTLTLHGRPLETINLYPSPGARLLALSRDGDTPGHVAALLKASGYGPSAMTVLEHMGGDNEQRLEGKAEDWKHLSCADLNVIAIQCEATPEAKILCRAPGLPDDAFEHEGKITKREVRAVTISKLMPLPGQLLWDVGAGSGSVAIEWMRAEITAKAIAIERHAEGCARIARNAAALGTAKLQVVEGRAPDALKDLADPDAIFIGGGIVSREGILETCLDRLSASGRLVANAVTMEAEERLLSFHNIHGGDMSRISIERAEPLGRFTGFKPLMTVTQYVVVK